jgi:hypothetical protein
MKRIKPIDFFTAFCDQNPADAHRLMITMLSHPTGGVSFTMPGLIDPKDHAAYWADTYAIAMKYIFKSSTEQDESEQK